MPPSARIAGVVIEGRIGKYPANTAAAVTKHLCNLRGQLHAASPERRVRILTDVDLLLERLHDLAS